MNKKIILIVIGFVVLGLLGMGGYYFMQSDNGKEKNKNNLEKDLKTPSNDTSNNKKSVVIYFSATSTTEGVAKTIAEVSDSKIIEIVPKDEYTSDDINYGNDNSRANKEQNDDSSRPEIKNTIDIKDYDTIYLGYPIWWGTVPKIILTFIDSYDLDGKALIPFCTSGGSDINASINDLKNYNKTLNIKDGKRFTSSTSKEDVKSWINSLRG